MTQTAKSVFLPKTSFTMRSNLVQQEPKMLAFWQKIDLYQQLRNQSKGRPKFILNFGPPYANGPTHIGHGLSEILKDILNRIMQMKGFDAPLVPGWDCHGLPIEHKVEGEFSKKGIKKNDIPVEDMIQACRDFATHWISIQKDEFIRMGILADWDHPYKTMDFTSEAAIAQQLSQLLLDGKLYRGKKPVMWSVVEQTALAEAEVEYENHTSDTVFVAFPIVKNPNINPKDDISLNLTGVEAIIWTTTPWSLPGNRAIAYGANYQYAVVKITKKDHPLEGRSFLVAYDLVEKFATEMMVDSSNDYKIIQTLKGCDLEGAICHHPLRHHGYDFDVPLLPGDHVTIEAGTGLVHTAPDHGLEDFLLGKQFDLDLPNCVQADGIYHSKVPLFAGMHVFKVAPMMIEALATAGSLLKTQKIVHSYPHSWRSKAPLIFRCTPQWFLRLDDDHHLRSLALQAIDEVQWYPAQGKNRIRSMVENRPDWCLSRQRSWGVPIAIFLHKETGEPLQHPDIQQRIVKAIEKEGILAWHRHDNAYFFEGILDPKTGNSYDPNVYEKTKDILDVWFDSGCIHHFVLQQRDDLAWPADVYFEGSDQHRGWFQSSLLQSCATTGKAPYKKVITHGFVLDEKGRKMSKSTGNVVAPQEIINKSGADLLRLWVALTDYSEDVRIGPGIIKHQEDIYHRLRNTLRYLLGNLCGLTKQEMVVPYDDLPAVERYILALLKKLEGEFNHLLENYDFANFYNKVHYFCSQDLSAFYFDLRKDSLYCDDIKNPERIAVRYTLNQVLMALIKWLAPVLSFSTEEAWQTYLREIIGQNVVDQDPDKFPISIHLATIDNLPDHWHDATLATEWAYIRQIRGVITNGIEIERNKKIIGSSLQADIVLYLSPTKEKWLLDLDWAQLAIVSHAAITTGPIPQEAFTLEGVSGIGVVVKVANGSKCPRCWKVGCGDHELETLCERCYKIKTNSVISCNDTNTPTNASIQ